jgi:ubiquinone/menaquinone biosynthesis C-methylase UbiE
MSTSTFETYGAKHPQLYAASAYPRLLLSAIANRGGTFLEVGTGSGSALRALLNDHQLQSFNSIIATDIAEVALESVRREVPTVRALQADALSLPLPDNSIDVYFSNQVIEHVPDDTRMATEAYRVIKPGGSAVIGSVLKKAWAWYYYRSNGAWTIDPTHLREYQSPETYRKIFTNIGFDYADMTIEPVAFPLHSVMLVSLMRLKIISADTALNASRNSFLQNVGRLRVQVPGYSYIYILIKKPDLS